MSLSILSAQKLVPALLESFIGVIVGSCGEICPSGRVIFMSGSGLGLGIGVNFSSPPMCAKSSFLIGLFKFSCNLIGYYPNECPSLLRPSISC